MIKKSHKFLLLYFSSIIIGFPVAFLGVVFIGICALSVFGIGKLLIFNGSVVITTLLGLVLIFAGTKIIFIGRLIEKKYISRLPNADDD